jgi:hypothetical protein
MKRVLLGILLAGLTAGSCPAALGEDTGATEPPSTVEQELERLRQAGIPTTFEELSLPDIPDEENGALLFRQAFELKDFLAEKYQDEWQYMPHDGTVPWDEVPVDKKKRVVDLVLHDPDFARLYQLLEKASGMQCSFMTREQYEATSQAEQYESQRHLAKFRGCVRMLATRAQLQAENGEIDEALRTVLTAFKTASSLRNEPRLLSQLVRLASEGIAAYNLEEVLNSGRESTALYDSLMDEIRAERKANLTQYALGGEIPGGPPHFSELRQAGETLSEENIRGRFEMEDRINKWVSDMYNLPRRRRDHRAELTELLSDLRKEGPEQFWHREELIHLQTMSTLYSLAGEPYWKARDRLNELRDEFESIPGNRGFWTRYLLPPRLRTFDSEARLDAQLGTAELALAVRIYKAKHKFYPSSLAQLVPDILPELPKDPYTGEDFLYNPRGMTILIYSVGPNLKDDGGTSWEVTRRVADGDIVWKLSYF